MDIRYEQHRAAGYRLLAACFYPPNEALFLQENLLENLSEALGHMCSEAAPFAQEMKAALAQCAIEAVAVDHARLFVGPFKLKAPPYGSVYLDGDRQVMGDSTMEVIQIYESAGLAMDDEFKELPDHIAAELEFMHFLIQGATEVYVKGDMEGAMKFVSTQDLFLNRFLSSWVSPFSEAVKQGAQTRFYRALVECASVFVCQDTVHMVSLTEKLSETLSGHSLSLQVD